MENTKKNVPEIRFPGFTDPWEQRKLETLCDVFTDGDWIEAKDQSDSGVRLVQTGNVGTTEYLDKENNKKWISEETFERLHCKEIFEDDILISRLPEPAGRACIMPYLGTRMITAVDCTIVRTSEEYDSKYLVQYLSTPMYFKVVNSFLGGGTRQRISRGNLSRIDIPIPSSIEEQKKIGECFESLDNLIALHQRKCEELKNYKKGLLQQMFPQPGEAFPRVRFPGFTNPWEQRKFQWLVDESIIDIPMDGNHGEKHPTSSEYVDNGIPFLMASDIHNGRVDLTNCKFISEERSKRLDKGFAKNGDVLITHKATIGEVAILSGLQPEYAVLTPQVTYYRIIDDTKLSREYLYAFFNSDMFQKEIKTKAAQSTRAYIGISAQRELSFSFPESLDEQNRIGATICYLDNLITLHQRKCEELKNYKKGLLQKMFV